MAKFRCTWSISPCSKSPPNIAPKKPNKALAPNGSEIWYPGKIAIRADWHGDGEPRPERTAPSLNRFYFHNAKPFPSGCAVSSWTWLFVPLIKGAALTQAVSYASVGRNTREACFFRGQDGHQPRTNAAQTGKRCRSITRQCPGRILGSLERRPLEIELRSMTSVTD